MVVLLDFSEELYYLSILLYHHGDYKPTIVIVHGGWHTPKHYSKLVNLLKPEGYEVHVPALLSMNQSRPPNADLYTDTAIIRGYVESLVDAGRTVVTLMHSYGGQVGTNALHGLGVQSRSQQSPPKPGGVAHLIYMCVDALTEGKSMVDKVRHFNQEHLLKLVFDFADDDTCVHRDPKPLVVGSGVEDAELEEYCSTLIRWNGKTMYQELNNPPAWREIPTAYVIALQDHTVPVNYQMFMIEAMRNEGQHVRTFELNIGHCPNLTMPNEMKDIINQVVTS